jgi:ADP-ribosyl-[dinitrogen reductase] hydrolase
MVFCIQTAYDFHTMFHPITDKYKGCLVGLAIGDALGAPFEFWRQEKIRAYFSMHELELIDFQRGEIVFPAGFYTDDTSMMLCLASSLVENGFDLRDQFERYKKWLSEGYMTPFGDRSYGVGQQTLKALLNEFPDLETLNGNNRRAGGNGSLMRCAPIGLLYQSNYNEIRDKSLWSSYITHNYTIAGWTCVVFNAILSLILDGVSKQTTLLAVMDKYEGQIPQEIEEVLLLDYSKPSMQLSVSGYCVDTLRIALWAWISSDNYSETIMRCFALDNIEDTEGNDTDTFAAVAGALAGCYYGYEQISVDMRNKIMNHETIYELGQLLFENCDAYFAERYK